MGTGASAFGSKWTSLWHHDLVKSSETKVEVLRADGRVDTFTKNASGAWVSDPDVVNRLSTVTNTAGAQTGWKVTLPDDSTESYNMAGKLTAVTKRSGLVTTLTFDAANRLQQVTGPFDRVLVFGYDTSNRVSQVTLPNGGLLRYGYDAKNNLTSVTYPDGNIKQYLYENAAFPNALTGIIDEKGARFATYAYDSTGRATSTEHAGAVEKTIITYNANGTASAADARGNTHAYTLMTQFGLVKPVTITGTPVDSKGVKALSYDSNGYVESTTDYNGNVTIYVHDARGLETSRTEAYGTPQARTIATEWHATWRLPTRITEPGRVTSFNYDPKGNLKTRTITGGGLTRIWSYTHNAKGQVLTVNGPRTDVTDITRFAYAANGNLTRITDPLGRITSFTNYNPNGQLTRMVDPNGLVTTYAYTVRGRVRTRTVGSETTTYTYDKAAQLTKATRPDGSAITYTYDNAHRLTTVRDSLGNRIAYTLNPMSLVTQERRLTPANVVRWQMGHVYDTANRLATDSNAFGQLTSYSYDANGNLTGITDPLNRSTGFEFDALNRQSRMTDAAGGLTALDYDANDQLRSVTDPRGNMTRYGFDGLGNPNATDSPDTGETTRTFDGAGNVLSSTDARGITTTYAYDALDRMTGATASDGTAVAYRYDEGVNGIGHLTGMSDPGGTTSWTYDAHVRVTGRSQSMGTGTLNTAYTYDGAGRLAGMVYPSGRTLAYGYDTTGRISSITVDGQALLSNIGYEPFGPVAGWEAGNGTYHQRIHDLDGSLEEVRVGFSVGGLSRSLLLDRDAGRQIVAISDSAQPTASFDYDGLGRLTQFLRGSTIRSFDYDANGNRLTMASDLKTTSHTYAPDSNRLLGRSDGAETAAYTYDDAGNLIGDGVRSYAYDGRGRLVKVTQGAGVTEYRINGLGQRVAKSGAQVTGGDNWFTYDEAGHLIGEYGATGTPIAETVWLGDLPVAVLKPGAVHWVHPDHLGAPWVIANAAGNAVWSWVRGPFGGGLPTGSFTYNLRFPGQYYDKETGLHYNHHRDYDPNLGRYIQSDPIGLDGGVNTYAYAGGDPVAQIDPTGTCVGPLALACLRAAIGVAQCAVNPVCRAIVYAGVSQLALPRVHAVLANLPLVLAATRPGTPAYASAQFLYGSIVGSLPTGINGPSLSSLSASALLGLTTMKSIGHFDEFEAYLKGVLEAQRRGAGGDSCPLQPLEKIRSDYGDRAITRYLSPSQNG